MLKVKFYRVDKATTKSVLIERLEKNQYCEEKGFGFDILRDDDDFIVQFIERIIGKQEFELADGTISELETVSYIKVKFGIRFYSKYALYILNPPRSMKYPFEMIRTLFDVDCQLQPVEFELKKVLHLFDTKYDYVIKSMSLSNIQCDVNSVAKTKMVSTKDLHSFYIETYDNTPAVIDTVHMVVDGVDVELSRTGRFRVGEANLQSFMLMLEHSLA